MVIFITSVSLSDWISSKSFWDNVFFNFKECSHSGFLKSRNFIGFSRWQLFTMLDFWIHEILGWQGSMAEMCHYAIFHQNRLIHCGDIAIFCFFWTWWTPSWISSGHIWTTHGEYLVVSITCNICCDLCSNFSIANVSILGMFGWKVPIHVPKNGVLELLDPLSGLQY